LSIKEKRKVSEFKVKRNYVYLLIAGLLIALFTGLITVKWGEEPAEPPLTIYTAPDGVQFNNWADYYNYYLQGWGTPPPDQPTPPSTVRDAAKLQLGFHDAITDASVSGSTTELDIGKVKSGYWDPLSSEETVSITTASFQSALYYKQGDILILHCLSDTDGTGGTDHYDTWYYVKLVEGEHVRGLTPSTLETYQSSPQYLYTISLGTGESTGYTVSYTAGTTPYWDIGVLDLYSRSTAANLDTYLKHLGTTLASITGGTAFVDTDGEITANGTMTSTAEDLYVDVYAGAVDISYALPFYTISQKGQFMERRAVLVFSTAMTAIGTQVLYDEGWSTLSKPDLTAEVAFYKVLEPMIPNRGDKFIASEKIPIDASAAASSTAFVFKIWMLDLQIPAYVASGSTTTSIPTAYGLANEYGIDAVIFAVALTVSSGAGATEVLRAYITTP